MMTRGAVSDASFHHGRLDAVSDIWQAVCNGVDDRTAISLAESCARGVTPSHPGARHFYLVESGAYDESFCAGVQYAARTVRAAVNRGVPIQTAILREEGRATARLRQSARRRRR